MAIYAQKSGGSTGQSGSLRTKLSPVIQDGSTLVYDASAGAFVDAATGGTAITEGRNLGGTHTVGVLRGRNRTTLEFRELQAGPGVSLIQDDDSITIAVAAAEGSTMVPGSYRITIDADDSTDDDARLELFTVRAASDAAGISTDLIPPLTSSAVHTGINAQGLGYFEIRDGGDFRGHGFAAGMWVKVSNALNQTGTYRLAAVLNQNVNGGNISTLVLDVPFTGSQAFNLGGPKPSVAFEAMDVVVLSPVEIASYSIDFGPDGVDFRAGTPVRIAGTPDQDGTYRIAAVVPRGDDHYSTLVLSPETPLEGTAGPQAGRVTFHLAETEIDTGFWVTERGHLRAVTGSFANRVRVEDPEYRPNEPGDLVTKRDLDRATRRPALRYFFANLK